MPYYNYSNATNIIEMLQYNSTVTDGAFGISILILIFVVFFVATKRYRWELSFMFASWTTTISAGFLWLIGLISGYLIAPCVVLLLLSIMLVKYTEKST